MLSAAAGVLQLLSGDWCWVLPYIRTGFQTASYACSRQTRAVWERRQQSRYTLLKIFAIVDQLNRVYQYYFGSLLEVY
jgi:hypothetical protein